MGAVFAWETVSCKQCLAEIFFTISTQDPSSVSLATRMQVGPVVIWAALIGSWTAVTLRTELKVNLVAHRVSPEVLSCRQRRRAIATRWARKALDVARYVEAFTSVSVDTVGSNGAQLGDKRKRRDRLVGVRC